MSFQLESLECRQFLSGSPHLAIDTSRLIFTAPQAAASQPQWVTLQNTGRKTLALNSISLSGSNAAEFSFNRKHVPAALAPGESASVKVVFNPASPSVESASLDIASNDPSAPVISITLRGLGTAGQFGEAEPSLQKVLDTLQIPVNVGDQDISTSKLDDSGTSEEVSMPLLKKAGDGQVRLTLLSAFTWEFSPVADFGWYRAKGPVTERQLFEAPAGNSQTVTPTIKGTTTFDPGTVNFGLYSHWPIESHGDVYSEDYLNTWDTTSDHQHKVRFYPFKKSYGRVVPNTYVVVMEEGQNSDFQDAVMVIENVQPYMTVAAPSALTALSVTNHSVNLSWMDNSNNEANFQILRSTKKNGTYSLIATVGANVKVFSDTNVAAGTSYFYYVKAIDGSISSSLSNRAVGTTAV